MRQAARATFKSEIWELGFYNNLAELCRVPFVLNNLSTLWHRLYHGFKVILSSSFSTALRPWKKSTLKSKIWNWGPKTMLHNMANVQIVFC